MGTVLIVLGYGSTMTPELRIYLEAVIEYCNKHEPDVVIYSGGYTNRLSRPDTSEASLMMGFVSGRLSYRPEEVVEQDSYTTVENIRNCARILNLMGVYRGSPVTVACERTRARGVRFLCKFFMAKSVRVMTMSFDSNWLGKSRVVLLYNAVLAHWPALSDLMRQARIRRAEKS